MDQNIILLLKQLNLSLEQYGRNQMKNLDISPSQSLVPVSYTHLLLPATAIPPLEVQQAGGGMA